MPSRQWPGVPARDPWLRRMSPLAIPALPLALVGIAAWQTVSGLGNVLLGWPLVAAVAHTAGAAALVVVLTFLIVRAQGAPAVAAMAWANGPRPLAS